MGENEKKEEDRRYEISLAPRMVLFRVKIFHKHGDVGYDANCSVLKEDLKAVFGEEAKVDSFPYMSTSMIFHIRIPFEREDGAYDIIRGIVEKYFPN